jgi:predicted TIM-barrel fold metal-dependent hydrolase
LKHFIKALGQDRTRGCAVIDEQTSDAEMTSLAASGVRGIRLNLYGYKAMTDVGKQIHVLQIYADRVRSRGWFVEFLQIEPQNWASLGQVIPTLGLQVVTDHHALLKAASMLPSGVGVIVQPGLAEIIALLKTGNFWIKLSAPYRSSIQAPYYEDMKPLVLALVEANPKRVLWGSDWPHTPNMKVRSKEDAMKETPFQDIDDRAWLSSLRAWLTNEQWRLLMINNPEELYMPRERADISVHL